MYDTGNAGFLAAACSYNRGVDIAVTVAVTVGNSLSLNSEDIVSYKLTSSSIAGKAFVPGSFVAAQFELVLNANSDKVSAVDFKTAGITCLYPHAYIWVENTRVDSPLGRFYPDKDGITLGDDGQVTIKASSINPSLYREFNSSRLTLPCTIAEAITKMSSLMSLKVNVSEADFPNLGVQLQETFSLVTTYKEALIYIAEAIGAYVYMGRNGQVYLGKLFNGLVDIGCVLDDNYLFSVSKQESSVKPFQKINIKANKDDLGVSTEVSGITTNCEYSIIGNPLTYGHPEDFLAGLVQPTSFTEFYPAKISFQGRPDVDIGDVLTYVYKGSTYILPICTHVFEYNGGFKTTVESMGSDKLQSSSLDSGLKNQVVALRQNINVLIRDLNQTKSEIVNINGDISDMSTLLQTANGLLTRVEHLEGELEKATSWEQTANNLKLSIETVDKSLKETQDTVDENHNTLLSYFDFQADGLTIGVSNSNIKLKLSNNKIQFIKDGTTEVAYFSEGKLYVTDAHFLSSLILGNFEFVPRANGNLSLRRRG